jgi:hypothetical protein
MRYQIRLNPLAYVEAVAVFLVAVTLPVLGIVGMLAG